MSVGFEQFDGRQDAIAVQAARVSPVGVEVARGDDGRGS